MTCQECQHQMDIPPELLDKASQAALAEHLLHCPSCREELERLSSVLSRFKAQPVPLPKPELLLRLNARIDADLSAQALVSQTPVQPTPAQQTPVQQTPVQQATPIRALPPEPQASFWSQVTAALRRFQLPAFAVAATLLIGMWISPDPVRWKGAPTPQSPLSLDVQVSIERMSPDPSAPDSEAHRPDAARPATDVRPRLERAEDGSSLHPNDGLLFHFEVAGGSQLLLIERDPRNRLKVVFERSNLPEGRAASSIDITTLKGKPLSYVPEGPPGDYTFLVVLARQTQAIGPAQLDEYWGMYVDQLLDPTAPRTDSELRLEALRFQVVPNSVPLHPPGEVNP